MFENDAMTFWKHASHTRTFNVISMPILRIINWPMEDSDGQNKINDDGSSKVEK